MLPALKFGLSSFLNYPGFNATFTNLLKRGGNGPKPPIGGRYNGQDHEGQVKISNESQGFQQWTVPYTGQYRIEAVGAAGGYDKNQTSAQYRGRGARMVGIFNLSQGEIIQILVGQEGEKRTNFTSSGGGGGTFVVRGSNTSLIVAGGGGGLTAATSRHQGCDANISTSGNPGYNSSSGGSDGHGGNEGLSGEINNENNCFHFSCYKIHLFGSERTHGPSTLHLKTFLMLWKIKSVKFVKLYL